MEGNYAMMCICLCIKKVNGFEQRCVRSVFSPFADCSRTILKEVGYCGYVFYCFVFLMSYDGAVRVSEGCRRILCCDVSYSLAERDASGPTPLICRSEPAM